ncbi:MAG TPA: diaminopimelate decarboxylase [Herpetosiphonaceae bacterium]
MQPLHSLLWPTTATITTNNRLSLAGCDTVTLAQEYGTPLYVLDEATLHGAAARFLAALRRAYPADSAVHYAGKALLNTAVAQLVARWGLGLDCVSLGELAITRRAGVALEHVHLHGNAKPRSELVQALAWGVGRIMVDSLDELRVLDELTRDRLAAGHAPQPILLRVNPGVDVHTHAHIQTGQLDSKFGLPIATGLALQAVEYALQSPGLELVGIHAHLGSQIAELEALALGVERLLALAAALGSRYGWHLRELSPGGGLGVPYRAEDPAPEIEAYVQTLADAVIAGCERWSMPLPKLVIEPGRSLIARAVVALYEVLAVKTVEGVRTFVAVDGGMGDNIRPALYDARYTVLRADRAVEPPTERVTVVGRYCESGDVLLRDVLLPPLEPGALLAIPMAGAYTLSMASTYNLVPRPPLVLVRAGHSHVLQRRETVDDLALRDLAAPPDSGSEANIGPNS